MIRICERQTYEHTFNGRIWLFEDSPYGGPWPVNKRTGELYNRIPMSFWDAHNDWLRQRDTATQLPKP